MQLSERIGDALGRALAPVFTAVSRGRHARTFHPWGDLVRASAAPISSGSEPLEALGRALAGNALVRFSNALWKAARWPDALGCAISLIDPDGTPAQHLLFATIRRPWTMPFAPFSTMVGDYLANDYFAVSPFRAPGLDRIWLRLRSAHAPAKGLVDWAARRHRLSAAIDDGKGSLELGAATSPWGPFVPFARIELEALMVADPATLKFDPFLTGRGLHPIGFIHALRHGAYAGSRAGRHERAPLRLATTPRP